MRRGIRWLASRASRDTTSGQFIAEIDGLRFVAIFSVILFHLNWFVTSKTGRPEASDPLTSLLANGHIGVQLFFVISGFVIALPFAKAHLMCGRPPGLRQYFFRRLTRLEPPYICNLVIRFALLLLATSDSAADLLPHLLASICYLHNLVYGSMSKINFVAWSLEIELQFYLLAPLATSVFAIRSKACRRSILAAAITAFSVAAYLLRGNPRFDLSILAAAHYFLAGFLLVDLYLTDWDQNPEKSRLWDLVSVVGWAGIVALLYLGEAGPFFIVFPTFVAYVAAFRGAASNRLFCRPFVYTVGGMCYTFYLYHYSIISGLGRPLVGAGLLGRYPSWLEVIGAGLVIIPPLLVVCTLLFILIEKPCMKKDWYLKLMARVWPGIA